MKNKNIKNKPQKCGRWLFLHSRFSKIFRGRTPLIKGIGPDSSVCRVSASGNGRSRVRSRAATYQSRLKMVLAAPRLALRLTG